MSSIENYLYDDVISHDVDGRFVGVIGKTLLFELRSISDSMGEYLDNPSRSPMSTKLNKLMLVCDATGVYGIRNFLKELIQLALIIEVDSSSTPREISVMRAKSLHLGISSLGAYSRSLYDGTSFNSENLKKTLIQICSLTGNVKLSGEFSAISPSIELRSKKNLDLTASLNILSTKAYEISLANSVEERSAAVKGCSGLSLNMECHGYFEILESIFMSPSIVCHSSLDEKLRIVMGDLLIVSIELKSAANLGVDAKYNSTVMSNVSSLLSDALEILHADETTSRTRLQLFDKLALLYWVPRQFKGDPKIYKNFVDGTIKFEEFWGKASGTGNAVSVAKHASSFATGAVKLKNPLYSVLASALDAMCSKRCAAGSTTYDFWISGAIALSMMFEVVSDESMINDSSETDLCFSIVKMLENVDEDGICGQLVSESLVRKIKIKGLTSILKETVKIISEARDVINEVIHKNSMHSERASAEHVCATSGEKVKSILTPLLGIFKLLSLTSAFNVVSRIISISTTASTWRDDDAANIFYMEIMSLSLFVEQARSGDLTDFVITYESRLDNAQIHDDEDPEEISASEVINCAPCESDQKIITNIDVDSPVVCHDLKLPINSLETKENIEEVIYFIESPEDIELLDVFLKESIILVDAATKLISIYHDNNSLVIKEHLVTICRAFHTLKGSGITVGFPNLGIVAEAAQFAIDDWIKIDEDLINVPSNVIDFCDQSIKLISKWIQIILLEGFLKAPQVDLDLFILKASSICGPIELCNVDSNSGQTFSAESILTHATQDADNINFDHLEHPLVDFELQDTAEAIEPPANSETSTLDVQDTAEAIESPADSETSTLDVQDTAEAIESPADSETSTLDVQDTAEAIESPADSETSTLDVQDTAEAIEPPADSESSTLDVQDTAETIESPADSGSSTLDVQDTAEAIEPPADSETSSLDVQGTAEAIEPSADSESSTLEVQDTAEAIEPPADSESSTLDVQGTAEAIESPADSESSSLDVQGTAEAIESPADSESSSLDVQDTAEAIESPVDSESSTLDVQGAAMSNEVEGYEIVSENISIEEDSVRVDEVIDLSKSSTIDSIDLFEMFNGEDSGITTNDICDAETLLANLKHEYELASNVQDVFGDSKLLSILIPEVQSGLSVIDDAIVRLLNKENVNDALVDLSRTVHNLKGALRTGGAMRVGSLLHVLEDDLALVSPEGMTCQRIEAYQYAFDIASRAIEEMDIDRRDIESNNSLLEIQTLPLEFRQQEIPAINEADQVNLNVTVFNNEVIQYEPINGLIELNKPVKPSAQKRNFQHLLENVQVSTTSLTTLSERAGESIVLQGRATAELTFALRGLKNLSSNIDKLSDLLEQLSLQADIHVDAGMRLGMTKSGFDTLEIDHYTSLQEITRTMSESMQDIRGTEAILAGALIGLDNTENQRRALSAEVQREVDQMMVINISSRKSKMQSVIRLASTESNKSPVIFELLGKAAISGTVMSKLAPAIDHILRNAVAHGIENSFDRKRAGKEESGKISLTVSSTAEKLIILISDDGAGINYENVVKKARQMGIASSRDYSEEEVHELIFAPGLTTAKNISELSGRGVGLDSVQAILREIGGDISIKSRIGKGTEFRLEAPMDIVALSVIPATACGYTCMIPSSLVESIVPVPLNLALDSAAAGSIEISGKKYKYVRLGWLVAEYAAPSIKKRVQLLLCGSDSKTPTAFEVEEIETSRKVLVRPLGKLISGMSGLIAGTTLADGSVALIANPMRMKRLGSDVSPGESRPVVPLVMIVDDSSTVRMVTSRFLSKHGYEVAEASDGIDALETLRNLTPDVFLLDVEMPRMGGFELVTALRSDERFANTPIVMITSRTAQKHRDHAASIGVNDYIGKPFEDDELRQILKNVLSKPITV